MIEPLPGDAIRNKRRLYWHYGLYAGKIDGEEMVFENTGSGGVKLVALKQFCESRECEFVPYDGTTKREDIIARANSILGKKRYNLLKNNCEHFVTWCQDGEAKSMQVRRGVKISSALITAVGIGIAGKLIYDKLKKKRTLSR